MVFTGPTSQPLHPTLKVCKHHVKVTVQGAPLCRSVSLHLDNPAVFERFAHGRLHTVHIEFAVSRHQHSTEVTERHASAIWKEAVLAKQQRVLGRAVVAAGSFACHGLQIHTEVNHPLGHKPLVHALDLAFVSAVRSSDQQSFAFRPPHQRIDLFWQIRLHQVARDLGSEQCRIKVCKCSGEELVL
jgi:hypothetical protein